jgi:hypothetical protein
MRVYYILLVGAVVGFWRFIWCMCGSVWDRDIDLMPRLASERDEAKGKKLLCVIVLLLVALLILEILK